MINPKEKKWDKEKNMVTDLTPTINYVSKLSITNLNANIIILDKKLQQYCV